MIQKLTGSFHISMEWNGNWIKLWNVNIYQWNEFNSFCNGMIANNSNRQVFQDCHNFQIYFMKNSNLKAHDNNQLT